MILDEVHAVAGTKRGAHLALSLERLERLVDAPFQRVGLSATQRPMEEIGRFVAGIGPRDRARRRRRPQGARPPGRRPGRGHARARRRRRELSVPPLADGVEMGVGVERSSRSIWPSIYPAILELVRAHRSTIVFVNNRRLAERLALRINELAGEELARAHHGSLAREQRLVVEELLKAGQIPCLVATSSLELGIDMGAVDLVIQVESPKSVARGLQRVGPRGPRSALGLEGPDLPEVPRRPPRVGGRRARDARGGDRGDADPAEPARRARAADRRDLRRRGGLGRRAPRARAARVSVLGALARAARERPRHARRPLPVRRVRGAPAADRLGSHGRHGARAHRRAAARGHERRDDPGPRPLRRLPRRRRRARRRARRGDGVRGARGPDVPARRVDLADRGDHARPRARLAGSRRARRRAVLEGRGSRAPGRARREDRHAPRASSPRSPTTPRSSASRASTGSTRSPRATSSRSSASRRRRPASFPSDRTIVVERFRDEIGDWRVCILSPFGGRVHAPWAMALRARLRDSLDLDVQSLWSDDGIALHFPDADVPPPLADLLLEPDEIEDLLLGELAQSALYGARFRENAARALLIPRRRPGQRTPLWQQRLKAQSLLQVARRYPQFPIVLETYRECLQDVFDLPALRGILRGHPDALARRRRGRDGVGVAVRLVAPLRLRRDVHVRGRHAARGAARAGALARPRPPPRAHGHRGAARAARPRRDRAGRVVAATDAAERRRAPRPPAPRRPARRRRVRPRVRRDAPARASRDSRAARRHASCSSRSRTRVSCATRSESCRPAACRRSSSSPSSDALRAVLRRYAKTHGPFTTAEVAARFGLDARPSTRSSRALERDGRARSRRAPPRRLGARVVRSRRPAPHPARDARGAAARGRARRAGGVRPLPSRVARDRAAPEPARGARPAAGRRAARRRSGRATSSRAACPAFRPADLDVLCASGEVVWVGAGLDRVAVYFRDDAPLLGPPCGRAAAGGRRARPRFAPRSRQRALFWADLVEATGLAGGGRPRRALGARLGRRGDERLVGAAARVATLRAAATRPRGPALRADAPDDRRRRRRALVARGGALRRIDRSASARGAPARAPGDRHARRRARRGHPRRLRRGLRGAEGARDARRLPARLLRRRVSAARSSPCRARSSDFASCGSRGAATSPRRSCSPRPIPRSRTARRCRGRDAPALALRASPARGSCCSTARRRSSSSAAGARSSRSASRIRSGSGLRSRRSSRTCERAARSVSRSSASTARRSPRRTSCSCSSRPASSPAAPRRAASVARRQERALAGRVPGGVAVRAPHLYPLLRGFVLGSFVVLGRELEEGAELPFAFEEHVERARARRCTSSDRSCARSSRSASRCCARARTRGSRSRSSGASRRPRSSRGPTRARARARTRRSSARSSSASSISTAEACGGFDWDDEAFEKAYAELEASLFGERRRYVAVAPLVGHLAREAGRARAGPRRSAVRRRRARDALARVARAPSRGTSGASPIARSSSSSGASSTPASRLRRTRRDRRRRQRASPDDRCARRRRPVLFETLDGRPFGIQPVLPIAATQPPGESSRLDSFRAPIAVDVLAALGDADGDPELAEALDRWELSLFQNEPFRGEQLRAALASLLGETWPMRGCVLLARGRACARGAVRRADRTRCRARPRRRRRVDAARRAVVAVAALARPRPARARSRPRAARARPARRRRAPSPSDASSIRLEAVTHRASDAGLPSTHGRVARRFSSGSSGSRRSTATGAAPAELVAELRALLVEAEAWSRAGGR